MTRIKLVTLSLLGTKCLLTALLLFDQADPVALNKAMTLVNFVQGTITFVEKVKPKPKPKAKDKEDSTAQE